VLSAFFLLPAIGLRATIIVAAAVNAGVFIAAWALARALGPLAPSPEPRPIAGVAEGPARWILPLILASGFASFTYEVFWVRLIGHEVGSGTDAFATMLASFLAGIAIGSAVAVALRLERSPRGARLRDGAARDRCSLHCGFLRGEPHSRLRRPLAGRGAAHDLGQRRGVHGDAIPLCALHRRHVPTCGADPRAQWRG
jgi:hypothetical protein